MKIINYEPTRAQIARECERIRKMWGPVEERRRNCYPVKPVEINQVRATIAEPKFEQY